MGKEKAGFLTPKAIGNRIKSKGLQKLRWYCQMCQKQCRDENGFKCHCMSEAHQRQLLIAGENPGAFNNFFSSAFYKDFMQLLKTRFGTKRVQNNVVYNEYISEKEHIHMNSTRWVTLTGFTKWLGREGICKVDQTEKGWFIQYIDRDPLALARQKELEKQKAREKGDDERHAKAIDDMVKRGQDSSKDSASTSTFTELVRDDEGKISLNLQLNSEQKATTSSQVPTRVSMPSFSNKRKQTFNATKPPKKAKSALDEIIAADKRKKEMLHTENWICKDIVVKIITKRLGDRYFKKKAVVNDVQDKFTAIVTMLDSGDKVKFDQTHLETVIPAIGKPVLIVNGGYRGCVATLESIDTNKFSATLTITQGPLNGRTIKDLKYEDFSKKID
uniref:DNA/RNA-binding protein KIN17 n=1 Tax=Ciona savignyi TaxID=51511 RepID=H2ZGT9_CIOSA